MKRLITIFFAGVSIFCKAQTIVYSQPDKDDSRSMSYEIIGKMNGNFLVYKTNNNSMHNITVLDAAMNVVEKNNLDFINDRVFNVDFVQYADYAFVFYQYQKKNIIYNMAAKLNAMGKIDGQPMQLDTTDSRDVQNNKIYSFVQSADKQKIMFFKVNSYNSKVHYINTYLYDKNLQLLEKNREAVPMNERNSFLTAFEIDNKGNFLFFKAVGTANNDNITQLTLICKYADSSNFKYFTISRPNNIFFDEIKLKANNSNNQFIATSFYGTKRRGDIQGLYISIFDIATQNEKLSTVTVFDDNFRDDAKGDANIKQAFNDYYIKQIIPKKTGGFLLTAECEYSYSRDGNNLNRWDYMNNPYSNSGYYGFGSSAYGYPWGRGYNNYTYTKYIADNIALASFDSTGKIEWSNVMRKSQFDESTDAYIGYGLFNAGSQLKFLYNELIKQQYLLTEQSLNPDGQIIRSSTLKNLDQGYVFMPRNAKQVAAKQIIVPCMYRNSLCFAKIDY